MKTYFIYSLSDPDTLLPFYVGMSTDPETRLYNHIRGLSFYKKLYKKHGYTTNLSATQYYIMSLKELPVLEVLEEVSEGRKYAAFVEAYWIQQLSTWGFSLTNSRHNLRRWNNYKSLRLEKRVLAENALRVISKENPIS